MPVFVSHFALSHRPVPPVVERVAAGGDTDSGLARANWMVRAFADFVLGSLILHFFCINFIN